MSNNNVDESNAIIDAIDKLANDIKAVRGVIGNIIFGQSQVIEETLITILSGGHLLLVGVPGLGKTRLVETLGKVFGLDDRRIQFTPDLMPSDILGSEVLEESDAGRRSFRFIKGPVFCQLLLADEINRASPRTQSALLQAMQERRVSIAGQYHDLPSPFHVLATQNPLELEGTYPLPEAQLDRFFMQIDVGYPDIDAERQIMARTTSVSEDIPAKVMDVDALIKAQKLIREVPASESVADAILAIVRAGRPEGSDIKDVQKNVSWGPGPRAAQALMFGVRARAAIEGRIAPSVEDVLVLAHPILRHRMALTFSARAEGVTLESIINRICERVG